jgi:hypothetical protein
MPNIKNQQVIDRNAMRIYGCDSSTAISLNDGQPLRKIGSKAMSFAIQKQSAKHRGIEWNLTFKEWVSIWDESGKFAMRGQGSGRYCMARLGDIGAYAVGNVSIKTNADNARESLSHTTWEERFSKAKSRHCAFPT